MALPPPRTTPPPPMHLLIPHPTILIPLPIHPMQIITPLPMTPRHRPRRIPPYTHIENRRNVINVPFGEPQCGGRREGLEGDDDGAFFEVQEFWAEVGVYYMVI